MDSQPKPEDAKPDAASQPAAQVAPQDALEKTNEELASEAPATPAPDPNGKPPKKVSKFKQVLKRINVYLLLFLLILVIGAVVSIVGYLNSKKTPKAPTIATQTLTPDTLKQLANSDATIGDTGQTLTVQGNAVFSGQVLIRSNLNVAGTITLGGPLSLSALTVSNTANLQSTQTNTLQVANGSTFQGTVTVQHDLNVGGATSFSGPVTAGQITVTRLIMSGNAQLSVPNHIAFPGVSPGRSVNGGVLGAGGTASVNGSDTTGTVSVNTGNGPSPGCFVTLTFAKPFTSTPHVIISPVGAGAGQSGYYVNRSTTSFSICANTPPGNQAFAFDYFITD
jgi:cytoskeletal protein CcmA (bactofilin family)